MRMRVIVTAKVDALRDFSRQVPQKLSAAVEFAALRVEQQAKISIATSPRSGRVYEWIGIPAYSGEPDLFIRAPHGHVFPALRRAIPHKASAPGEPPAVDQGALINSIFSEQTDPYRAFVGAASAYGAHLEFGTRFMEARPFLFPAMESVKPLFLADCAAALGTN